ncbi:AfsR/SARP family transcriptional regulator [Streptomyces sp. SCSIO ZS0520]|uniref:AfsR/SARP family transcriptional regulator n=1 Tax=Streptomyces sp. SCSIO ZS0520 TaxID=2892996 RepID=UPI0021D7D97F|nr:tetratricopeptide repeat protein [Streptomyces sp. SCSIO ZS0520]
MELLLLGPVELSAAGATHSFSAGKEERLVVSLALNIGRLLTVDTLIDRLWDGDPPDHARSSVHTHVSRLRRKLKEAGAPPGAQPLIRRNHAYGLEESFISVDYLGFRRLIEQARTAASRGEDERVVELLSTARALWRGEALAGMDGLWPKRVRREFAEKHADAVLTQSAACLRLGRYPDLVPDLTELSQQEPEDEVLGLQLMLSLYGAGRYSDAMRVHQRISSVLRSEHGTPPGPRLARLHEDMLRRRPVEELVRECLGERGAAGGAREAETVPREAPLPGEHEARTPAPPRDPAARSAVRDVPKALPPYARVIGRSRELDAITGELSEVGNAGGTVVVTGTAGVGKSALAVQAARLLAERYPDGELYLNLRTYSGSQPPLDPEEALATLLRMLLGHEHPVPHTLAELTAMWRSSLARLRCVVVLDDAKDAAHIGSLLPGDSTSLMLVTSRRRIGGLPRALNVALELLEPQDAIAMFREIVGPERTQDIAVVARIVRLCGYLPLAIDLAGHRLRGRPAWNLGALGERLERHPGRLHELRDSDRQVERALAMSYEALTPTEQSAFRLLSLHPGAEFSLGAAAALLDRAEPQAEPLVDELLTTHLLQEAEADRYHYLDLLGEFARSLVQRHDSAEEQEAAMLRLLAFYGRAVAQADLSAHPHTWRPPADPYSPTGRPGPLPFATTAQAARTWLRKERGTLLALVQYARTRGDTDTAVFLAQHLFASLDEDGRWGEARALAELSADHWRARGRTAPLCRALLVLSGALMQLSDYPQARRTAEEVLSLSRAQEISVAEGEALRILGVLQWHQGAFAPAIEFFEAALPIKKATGTAIETARILNNIAISSNYLGRYEEALSSLGAAIEEFRRAGDTKAVGSALSNKATFHMDREDNELARECLEEAIPLLEASGNLYESATARANMADLLVKFGEPSKALPVYRESLAIHRESGDQKSQVNCLNGLGASYFALERHEEALDQYRASIRLAQDLGATHYEIVARIGAGRTMHSLGRVSDAFDMLATAVALARRVGEADEQVRALAHFARFLRAENNMREAYVRVIGALDVLGSRTHPDREYLLRVRGELHQVSTE